MENRRIYLKEWRKHRGYTQKQVVDWLIDRGDVRLVQTEASLSRLETGKQPWSEYILEALADLYECEVWELLRSDPGKEGKLLRMVLRMPKQQQERAEAVLEAMFKEGA